ncbi:MAG TPA: BamA/TamA family outer membrane protein [Candidatus Deferrimicrobium sp.]|nr:BamA/TamA family outer membrane protein [Candidatus Deferrimicrobium sp.]
MAFTARISEKLSSWVPSTASWTGIMGGFLSALSITAIVAAEPQYKEYTVSHRQREFFEVTFDAKRVSVKVFLAQKALSYSCARDEIVKTMTGVRLSDSVRFDAEGLVFGEHTYPYSEISDARITDTGDGTVITFLVSSDTSARAARTRPSNRVEFSDDVVIEEDDFVRGMVLCVTGDVEVDGEVNRDVIALFGDIYLGPGAVARGDVVCMSGRIDLSRDASVYGQTIQGRKTRGLRAHRLRHKEKSLSLTGSSKYNRVDGATPLGGVRFDDHDSLLPSLWAIGGYAFASERSRYNFGLEQTLWRQRPLTISGSFFRRLASEDDWLLSDRENLVFTLLVTEDYKDYYESEGGSVSLAFKPYRALTASAMYEFERTKWLEAHPHLWSLFGGDKLFRENFSCVDMSFRQHSATEIDTTESATLSGRVEFDTRAEDDPFERSAWHATGEIEWSSPDLNSYFDYRRYTIAVRRYQRTHRHAMLLLRALYGGSDGYLPMYKRFYLGGLGTLYGYRHKEFMGSRFWMATVEYRVDFPRTDLAASISWDVGQIANDASLDRRAEVKHSLGLAAYVGKDARIILSKRLDRSFDDDPTIYVRFDHVF